MGDSVLQEIDSEISDIANNQRIWEQNNDAWSLRKARSNLFLDDNSRIEYLASQRFPNDKHASLKYINKDGDLYYQDPVGTSVFDGKKYSKEFPANSAVGWWGDVVTPNLAPTATFVADVGGGMAGAGRGFRAGQKLSQVVPHPLGKAAVILGSTALGGFAGNFTAGAVPRVGRELMIENFYNATPAELSAAYYDLLESSVWSLIPFGTGTVGTARIMSKFKGKEDALQNIINLGKDASVKERIALAKEFGIDITEAQASKIGSRARDMQYFLTRQPDTRKIFEFYDSQALQSEEAIRLFADRIGSGKTVGDINTRIKETGDWVLEELTRRRKLRATRLYDILKEAPDGIKVDNMQGFIDIIDSQIAGEVLDSSGKVIRTMDPSPTTIRNLEKFKKMFYKDGVLIDDLMSIDARRTSDVQKLIRSIQDTGGGDYGKIINLTETLTALMDEAAPIYHQARRVYDPTKPALQLIEKGVIGKFGKMMSDKQTATAMKNLFDPDVSLKSLRNARRLLQAADPDLFKDVKKQFILSKLDDFTRSSQLQKGLPRFKNYFQQPKIKAMMEEMLSPEEYTGFAKLGNVMDDVFSIQIGGSPTQPLQAIEKALMNESLDTTTAAAQNVLNLNKLLHLLTSRGAGDMVFENAAANQYNRYLQSLTNALVENPEDYAKSMDEMYNFFNEGTFRNLQIFLRGSEKGIESITEPEVQPYTGEQRGDLMQQIDQEISSINPNLQSNLIEPAFEPDLSPMQATSATILPDEKDREIAMRQLGGIGSLV